MGTETMATSEPQTCSQFSSYTKGTTGVLVRQELEEHQYLKDSLKKQSSQGKLRNCETQNGAQSPIPLLALVDITLQGLRISRQTSRNYKGIDQGQEWERKKQCLQSFAVIFTALREGSGNWLRREVPSQGPAVGVGPLCRTRRRSAALGGTKHQLDRSIPTLPTQPVRHASLSSRKQLVFFGETE